MHACRRLHTHICAHAPARACVHTCTRAHSCTHVHMYTHAPAHACAHTCTCSCTYVHTHTRSSALCCSVCVHSAWSLELHDPVRKEGVGRPTARPLCTTSSPHLWRGPFHGTLGSPHHSVLGWNSAGGRCPDRRGSGAGNHDGRSRCAGRAPGSTPRRGRAGTRAPFWLPMTTRGGHSAARAGPSCAPSCERKQARGLRRPQEVEERLSRRGPKVHLAAAPVRAPGPRLQAQTLGQP